MVLSPDPRMEVGDAKYEHELGPLSPISKAVQDYFLVGQGGHRGVAGFECDLAGA
jgi:hypothetical protein